MCRERLFGTNASICCPMRAKSQTPLATAQTRCTVGDTGWSTEASGTLTDQGCPSPTPSIARPDASRRPGATCVQDGNQSPLRGSCRAGQEGQLMPLTVTLKEGERVLIGQAAPNAGPGWHAKIVLAVVRVHRHGDKVQLSFDAPLDVKIVREEAVLKRLAMEKQERRLAELGGKT